MKYYLIVGEASGDLHASNLMKALKWEDPEAEFRFVGGDLMAEVGGTCVRHYKDLAYMGFVPVLLHLHTIFAEMKRCKKDVATWRPDVLILVDYPDFNLSVAKYVKAHTNIPVYYYISPKIWAWKEYRIRNIRRDVDELFSILPFETEFYCSHDYQIHYVGNPCLDAVTDYLHAFPQEGEDFADRNGLSDEPIVALLAGSRKQEIKDNLPDMIRAASRMEGCQIVVAGAPGIDKSYYERFLDGTKAKIVFGETYTLLQAARAALVTSGTATLETALFCVPQVVCYHTPIGRVISFLRKCVVKVKYISLVNLIAGKEVVPELVADTMTVENMERELRPLVFDDAVRRQMIEEYARVAERLGRPGASKRAAFLMVTLLRKRKKA